jgi:hypothetical protein
MYNYCNNGLTIPTQRWNVIEEEIAQGLAEDRVALKLTLENHHM